MKKIKNNIFLYLLPVVAYGVHHVLAGKFDVFTNYGISFGINLPFVELGLMIFLSVLVWKLIKKFDWWLYLVFVGGVVNFCDRLFFGYVRDYFKIFFVYNNLADLLIFMGLVIYIIEIFYETNKNNLRR